MNKISLAILLSVLVTAGFWGSKALFKKSDSDFDLKGNLTKTGNSIYWTCPMHPQIHQDHEGECPICHMKLVKISQAPQPEGEKKSPENNRAIIQSSSEQLELIGVQKTKAEKMTLIVKVPISGKVLSPGLVAFYIYEKGLKNIRPGLIFKGESRVDYANDISGVITSVDTVVDPTSRTVRVLGTINNGPIGLLSETSFSGVVLIELNNRLAIPESSVLHTGQGNLIYLIDTKNKLTPKFIKLGIKTEGYYEVLNGLSTGDTISSGPNFLIDSEAKIRGTR